MAYAGLRDERLARERAEAAEECGVVDAEVRTELAASA
jgi:hypothetical protein